jgi:hypothetical protein
MFGPVGGYHSNRGHSRHSLVAWQMGMLKDKALGHGEKSESEVSEEEEECNEEVNKRDPPLFMLAKPGSDSVADSPARNTRKKMGSIDESPMEWRNRGRKRK